jgi:hypothetical protein
MLTDGQSLRRRRLEGNKMNLHDAESLNNAKINQRLAQENQALQPRHNIGFQSMDDATC